MFHSKTLPKTRDFLFFTDEKFFENDFQLHLNKYHLQDIKQNYSCRDQTLMNNLIDVISFERLKKMNLNNLKHVFKILKWRRSTFFLDIL